MKLSGEQRKKLQEALIDAFPNKSLLKQMLSFGLNINLDSIAGGSNLEETVFDLIIRAEAENWIENLIKAAHNSNSGNQLLKDIAEELLENHKQEVPSASSNNTQTIKNTQQNYQSFQIFVDKNNNSMQLLEYPDGSVPLDSPFYLERNGIESLCYQTLEKPAALIRIKAPKLMGKTSLARRIVAQGEKLNYQGVYLDLGGVNKEVITNLDKFLRWLCSKVCSQLNLDNQLDNAWNTNFLGSNDNCTDYFDDYILNQIEVPLVLVLDEVDRLFPYNSVVEDFLGMLRSWHEEGKTSEVWKQLRLVLAHSTEVYIPLDYHQSPFNAGLPVELEEFNQQQIEDLATKHGINFQNSLLGNLRRMVGGHPYLLRLAMYDVAKGKTTFENLLESAATEAGIYRNHLRYLLDILRKAPDLVKALQRVVNSSVGVELDSVEIYKLHSLGLVIRENNHVTPRCQLYRDYFRRVL